MTSFYNGLPWPIYLLLSIGFGGYTLQFFLRNFNKFNKAISLGIVFITCSSIFAGVIRILILFGEQWNLSLIEKIPLIGLIGIPLICVGAFLQAKDNPEAKKSATIAIFILSFSLLLFGSVVIFALLK